MPRPQGIRTKLIFSKLQNSFSLCCVKHPLLCETVNYFVGHLIIISVIIKIVIIKIVIITIVIINRAVFNLS